MPDASSVRRCSRAGDDTVNTRARETGARELRLGMGADVEKDRFGTSVHQNCVYLQARDDYSGTVLRELVAEAGLREVG